MLAAEVQRDPNALLQAGFKHLESRVSSAVNPDEAIRTYKRCVFVGDPGAGKTTLLKYLTLRSADGTLDKLPDLPIRIELNAFAASGYHDLFDFAAHQWDEQYGFPMRNARAAMEERLKDGSALLLLDALDETVVGDTVEAAEASYQQVIENIVQAATRYPLLPIAVTARKAGYHQRSPLVGFTELEVLDFRLENELLEVIAHFLPTVRLLPEQNGQILAEIANEQGLLKEQARGWQGFLHLTLQEYFVAQYITHHHQQETLLIHCSDPWWEEVVLLYAGYTSDVSPFLQALLEPTDRSLPPDDICHTNLLTAGRCLTTRPTLSQISLWDRVIERLSELLLSSPYNLTKVSTAEVLAAIGS
jgi:NACHT domain